MKKIRNSNIEIIRIISIIMIVMSHYSKHSVGIKAISKLNLGINRFILESSILGNIGSILFVLISGYYLSSSKNIKLKKIIHLLFQVFFYSSIIYIVLCLIGSISFSPLSFIKALFPVTFKEYWFVSTYVVLYLLHPYINRLLNSFTRKEHFKFILLLFIIFSVINTLTMSNLYANELVQFIMFYCIGSYLYKFPNNILSKNNNNYKLLIASTILIILSIISFDLIGTRISFFNKNSVYFLSRTSMLAILFCIGLFDIFSRKKEFECKTINIIGSLIFGVYLISDNNYIRPILWRDIIKSINYIHKPYLILHLLISVFIIIIVCLIIEAIRKYLIENTIFKKLDLFIDKLQIRIDNKIDKKLSNYIK